MSILHVVTTKVQGVCWSVWCDLIWLLAELCNVCVVCYSGCLVQTCVQCVGDMLCWNSYTDWSSSILFENRFLVSVYHFGIVTNTGWTVSAEKAYMLYCVEMWTSLSNVQLVQLNFSRTFTKGSCWFYSRPYEQGLFKWFDKQWYLNM